MVGIYQKGTLRIRSTRVGYAPKRCMTENWARDGRDGAWANLSDFQQGAPLIMGNAGSWKTPVARFPPFALANFSRPPHAPHKRRESQNVLSVYLVLDCPQIHSISCRSHVSRFTSTNDYFPAVVSPYRLELIISMTGPLLASPFHHHTNPSTITNYGCTPGNRSNTS
jgi:hypothetical protein